MKPPVKSGGGTRLARRAFLGGALGAACLLRGPSAHGACQELLTRPLLGRSLALGTAFLLRNQRKAGNFQYELDYQTMEYTADDSPVRQAGAAWGLSLIHHARAAKPVEKAVLRALSFFEKHSKLTATGGRYIVYPGTEHGSLGTVALVALTLVDYLRVVASPALQQRLDEYLAFLVAARLPAGRFHQSYRHQDGKPHGAPSPYFDGEALLALVKAARHLGRSELLELALEEADAGHKLNVARALAADPDSNVTKGYYQWASMAYHELATWSAVTSSVHAERLLALADWMIDVHRTLSRKRNTGYAYEGIVPAYAIAARDGDEKRRERYRRVIACGLTKLTSWQVGHPLANAFIRSHGEPDERAVGGVQNHAKESRLRIDVTQHQMHAVMLARRHVFTT